MSVLRYPLFFLPIHHYTYEKYYQRHEEYVERQKGKYEMLYGEPYEQLSDRMKRTLDEAWWWPPWKFSDIVGYLDVGMDIGECMTANIYLRRKYFPLDSMDRKYRRVQAASMRNQYLYYSEVPKVVVRGLSDNNAYLLALDEIIRKAKEIIKRRNREFQLWLPPFDLSCINLVKAHTQAKSSDAL